MEDILKIELDKMVNGESLELSINWLRAELRKDRSTPFALIRYSLNGEEQPYGLRLDLQKRAFIDHIEDEEKDNELVDASEGISNYIIEYLRRHHRASDVY